MQFCQIRRRQFIGLVGGAAAAWPFAAHAQQVAVPAVGMLYSESPDLVADRLRMFRQGLKESGYVEGENVAIEYRFAEGQNDRLPELASQLIRRKVAVIAALSTSSALAAKAATATIPIVFSSGLDPVRLGLVSNYARPEGNLTGITFLGSELEAKRLEILHQLVPGAGRIAVLVNPANAGAETTLRDVPAAARAMGLEIQVLNASTGREIDEVFATFVRERPDAIFAGGDPFFAARRVQLATLVARHLLPSAFGQREIADAGGLMSYGSSIADSWRQAGAYTARILKGTKPSDLPVVQASKFDLVINHQTARLLGLTVPDKLLATADEVIE
jgi:putative ABC transport system substrate-binding protein